MKKRERSINFGLKLYYEEVNRSLIWKILSLSKKNFENRDERALKKKKRKMRSERA